MLFLRPQHLVRSFDISFQIKHFANSRQAEIIRIYNFFFNKVKKDNFLTSHIMRTESLAAQRGTLVVKLIKDGR